MGQDGADVQGFGKDGGGVISDEAKEAVEALVSRQDYEVCPPVIYVGVPDVGCVILAKGKPARVFVDVDKGLVREATEEELKLMDAFFERKG